MTCCFEAIAKDVKIAVASNFISPMQTLAKNFENDTGYKVTISAASSGKLYAQIKHGAPFDLFFSADQKMPKQLIEDGFAAADSKYTYAVGILVLWSNKSNELNAKEALINGEFKRIAIANPKLAPFGQASMQVIEKLSLCDAVVSKIVMGENVAQSFQFAYSGAADMGFVALSQVLSAEDKKRGAFWQIPANFHAEIKQDVVITKTGAENPIAYEFLNYVKGDLAKNMISEFGYKVD